MAKKDSRPYLTHDLGARNDPKLMALVLEMGGQGKAIWWDLVEMLWEQEGYLPMNFKVLAFDLRYCTAEDIEKVVTQFDLFQNDGDKFWNVSALTRIQHKAKVSAQRSEAGRAGGVASQQSRATQAIEEGQLALLPSNDEANDKQMLNGCSSDPSSTASSAAQAINKYIFNKLTNLNNQDKSIYTACAGEDIESFFIIFHFEKNSRRAAHEVARFLAHYSPTNWMIGGQPVHSKEALARKWTVEDPADRIYKDEKPLAYLKAAYINARNAGNEERWRIVREVRDMASKMNGGQVIYTFTCSHPARQLITQYGPMFEGIIINFA